MKLKIFVLALITALVTFIGTVSAEERITTSEREKNLINAVSDAEIYIRQDNGHKVTRAEFLQSLISLLKDGEVPVEHSFTDVESETGLDRAVQIAVGAGIINDGSLFRGNDVITSQEAAKMCINATNYKFMLRLYDNEITGYESIAALMNAPTGEMTCENAYKLLYNTLFAKNIKLSSEGYMSYTETTIFEDELGAYKVTGIVTANAYTGMSRTDYGIAPGRLEINGVGYTSENDYNDYLGYNVIAYCANDDINGNIVLYMEPRDVNIMTFKSTDAYAVRRNTVEYTVDGKVKDFKFKSSIEKIYNGRTVFNSDLSILEPQSGSVKFIDNNDDEIYDVAIIKDYEYMCVDKIDVVNSVVYDQVDSKLTLNLGEDVFSRIIDGGTGTEIAFGDIKKGMHLLVAKSDDGEMAEAIVVKNTVSGKIDMMNFSARTVKIGETELFIRKNDSEMRNFFNANIGNEVTVVAGVNNEAVAIADRKQILTYAYFIKSYIDEEEKLYLRLFVSSEDFINYECAKKVRVDGTTLKKVSEIQDALKEDGNEKSQLIKFRLNNEGQISAIDTALGTQDYGVCSETDTFDNLYEYSFNSVMFRYGLLYPHFILGNTVTFVIPEDISDRESFSVSVGDTSMFRNLKDYYNEPDSNGTLLEIYDVSKYGVIGAAVLHPGEGVSSVNIDEVKYGLVVEDTLTVVDEDGEETTLIYGWCNGEWVEWYLDSDVKIMKGGQESTLSCGDIVRVDYSRNKIIALKVDFDYSKFTKDIQSDAGWAVRDSANSYQYGTVYASDANGILLHRPEGAAVGEKSYTGVNQNTLYAFTLPSKLVICDGQSLRKATEADVNSIINAGDDADYILINQDWLVGRFAVIYSNK